MGASMCGALATLVAIGTLGAIWVAATRCQWPTKCDTGNQFAIFCHGQSAIFWQKKWKWVVVASPRPCGCWGPVHMASKFWHTCKCGQLMANRAGPLAQCFFICFSWAERTANRHAGWPRCRELARAAPEHQLAQLPAPAQQCPPVKLCTGACAHRQCVHRCIGPPGQICVPVHGLARHVPVHKPVTKPIIHNNL